MQRRYPLISVGLYFEVFLVWLNGDTANAAAMSIVFVVMAALAVLDGVLGGWGHPLSHCALVPGVHYRTQALALRWR